MEVVTYELVRRTCRHLTARPDFFDKTSVQCPLLQNAN